MRCRTLSTTVLQILERIEGVSTLNECVTWTCGIATCGLKAWIVSLHRSYCPLSKNDRFIIYDRVRVTQMETKDISH
jgi:hypothetical protein